MVVMRNNAIFFVDNFLYKKSNYFLSTRAMKRKHTKNDGIYSIFIKTNDRAARRTLHFWTSSSRMIMCLRSSPLQTPTLVCALNQNSFAVTFITLGECCSVVYCVYMRSVSLVQRIIFWNTFMMLKEFSFVYIILLSLSIDIVICRWR